MSDAADACKNFYRKDDEAFTKGDNVRVHNIYVSQIPDEITRSEVRSYFEKFGELSDVGVFNVGVGCAFKEGFVNFINAVDAAKVLNQAEHFIELKRISVRARDSSYQPKNIEELNDYCLDHICKMLKLPDQLRFSSVCQRFCNIFVMRAKVEYKKFNTHQLTDFSSREMNAFFKHCGKSIDKLTVNGQSYFSYMNLHYNYCMNLKSLYFSHFPINKNNLTKFAQNMKSLTAMRLNDCNLTDDVLTCLLELPKLEKLSVAGNYKLTGKHLYKFERLVSLDVSDCKNIQVEHLIEATKSLQALKVLNVELYHTLDYTYYKYYDLNEMIKDCSNVTQLKMSCVDEGNYECVARMPQLKHLCLSLGMNKREKQEELFELLAEHKSTQLEYLEFDCGYSITNRTAVNLSKLENLKVLDCSSNSKLDDSCLEKFSRLKHLEKVSIPFCPLITNVGLMALVRECTNLNYINVKCCDNINNDFVFAVIKLMQTRGSQQKQVLRCDAFYTYIDVKILNTTEYRDVTAYLRVNLIPTSLK